MRLTRRQSILASVGILVLFFVAVALLRPKSPVLPSSEVINPSSSNDPLDPDPKNSGNNAGPGFILDDFKREEIKDGKKVWEVKASRGRYNPGGGQAALENSMLWLYKKDGGIVTLKSDKAILKLEGAEGLSAADFIGNVIIVQDNKTTLMTDQASYDKLKDLITAPNLVKISDEKMNLEGIGMEVKVSTKEIRLLQQTKTLIEPKDTPDAKE